MIYIYIICIRPYAFSILIITVSLIFEGHLETALYLYEMKNALSIVKLFVEDSQLFIDFHWWWRKEFSPLVHNSAAWRCTTVDGADWVIVSWHLWTPLIAVARRLRPNLLRPSNDASAMRGECPILWLHVQHRPPPRHWMMAVYANVGDITPHAGVATCRAHWDGIAYLPGLETTVITKAVSLRRGPFIALRVGWPVRLPQIGVARKRNFC